MLPKIVLTIIKEDVMQLNAERDNFLTAESIDNSIFYGVDHVMITPKTVKTSNLFHHTA